MNPADQHIAELIETLATDRAFRSNFDTDADKRQTLINQIAQLRASMNPVIHQHLKQD